MSNAEIYKEIKKLEGQGIFPQDPTTFEAYKHSAIGVRIETALPESAGDIKPLEWTIDIINTRGCAVSLCDWQVKTKENGQKVLSFVALMRTPDVFAAGIEAKLMATSFQDFCWYHGNEGISPKHRPETVTLVDEGVTYGDLGWVMPCRFADRLIDALGKANEFLLSGTLEDAVLYGILTK